MTESDPVASAPSHPKARSTDRPGDSRQRIDLYNAGVIGPHEFQVRAHAAQNEVTATFLNETIEESKDPYRIFQKEGQNQLVVRLRNDTSAPVTFHAGDPPANPHEGSGPSGLYLAFDGMSRTDLKRFGVEATGWTSACKSSPGPSGRPIHRLVLYRKSGAGDVTLDPGGQAELSLTVSAPQDLETQKRGKTLTLRYPRLTSPVGVDDEVNQIQYLVVPPEPSLPSNLAMRMSGEVQIESQSEQGGDVPPNEISLFLHNTSASEPLIEGWSEPNRPTFTFVPSTVRTGRPASTILLRRQQAEALEVSAANEVARQGWAIDKDGIRFHLQPVSGNQTVLSAQQTAKFRVSNLRTDLRPGWGNAFVFVPVLPGYSPFAQTQPVHKIRAKPTVERFESNKQTVDYGSSVKLTWETYGYESRTRLKVPSLGIDEEVSVSGSRTIEPTAKTTNCTLVRERTEGSGSEPGKDEETLTIDVRPPSIETFTAEPSEVRYGAETTLKWAVQSAKEVQLMEELSGQKHRHIGTYGPRGSHAVTPRQRKTTYALKATGAGPTRPTQTTTVTVDWTPVKGISGIAYGADKNQIKVWTPSGNERSWAKRASSFDVVDLEYRNGYVYWLARKETKPTYLWRAARISLAEDRFEQLKKASLGPGAQPESIAVSGRGVAYVGGYSKGGALFAPRAIDTNNDNKLLTVNVSNPFVGIMNKRVEKKPVGVVKYGDKVAISGLKGPGFILSVDSELINFAPLPIYTLNSSNVSRYETCSSKVGMMFYYVNEDGSHIFRKKGYLSEKKKCAGVTDCGGLAIEPSTGDLLWVERGGNQPRLRRYILADEKTVDLATLDEYRGHGLALIPEK